MTDPSSLGARLGPRLADLMARAVTSHLHQSRDVRAQIHKRGLDAFWHGVGHEYRAALGDQLGRYAEHEEMPDELRALFQFLAAQPGEGASMLTTLYYGTGLGQTFGSVLSNWLAPIVHGDLHAAPNALLPPDLVAQMVAKGIFAPGDGESEAGGQAIASWRFDRMVENAAAYPVDAMAFDLTRRGIYGSGDLYRALKRAGYRDDDVGKIAELVWIPLQAADLADMTLRGIITQDAGRAAAERVGVRPADFDLLAEAQGEPPGPDQLVEAFRRGFIDQARLTRGIRQSRVRDEWIDVEVLLGHQPMDTSNAVNAVVQGHLTSDQGKRVAELNGLEPQYWDVMVETAGEPIARGEALELLNRGELSQAQVEQAIRESHVKDKYIPEILKLRRRLPPERTVITMLAHGAIDKPAALKLLLQLGFDQPTAEAIVKAGTAQRTTSSRHLAAGTIGELYADGAMTEEEALGHLKALGWDAADGKLELHVAELRREHSFRQQAATRVGTDYVDRLIDKPTATGYLESIGIPPTQRDALLALWDIERAARRRRLTEAQIHSAHKKGLLTGQDAHDRLVGMGYDDADATILLEI